MKIPKSLKSRKALLLLFYLTTAVICLLTWFGSRVNLGLYTAIILSAGTLALLFFFTARYMLVSPGKNRIALFSFAGLILVFLIMFLLSPPAIAGSTAGIFESKFISASLKTGFIMAAAVVTSLLVSELWSYFR